MAKHRFTYIQRYALWLAYDMKCFYCDRPLDFQNMTVDHVLPESLIQDPERLEHIIKEYKIRDSFPSFSINDYSNWVPSDGTSCNNKKGARLLSKTFTLFLLHRIQNRIPRVLDELLKLTHAREETKVLGNLATAIEQGSTSIGQVLRLLHEIEFDTTLDEPLVVAFSLVVPDILEMEEFPSELKDLSYPALCDALERDLVDFIRVYTRQSFHYSEASSRNGESLGVRLVFPLLSIDDEIDLSAVHEFMPWWEIMEITNFYQIYETTYKEVYGE